MKYFIGCVLSLCLANAALAAITNLQPAAENSYVYPVESYSNADWGSFEGGLYDVYADNRKQGIANFITIDFLLLNYSLIQQAVQKETELEQRLPALKRFIANLLAAVKADDQFPSKIKQLNQQWLALLQVLVSGESPNALSEEAKAEWALIDKAEGVSASPLFKTRVDYSQFKPRSYYAEDPSLAHYFVTLRYTSTILFPVVASESTGVNPALADTLIQQALQLATLILQNETVKAAYEEIAKGLSWQLGGSRDLSGDDLLQTAASYSDISLIKWPVFRKVLFERAQANGRQPAVIAGAVDSSRLEKGLKPADVLTGFRLLPQMDSPFTAAQQALVFDQVTDFEPTAKCSSAYTMGHINGRAVKAFPHIDELLDLLAPTAKLTCDTHYAGYEKATQQARSQLAAASGLPAMQLQLLAIGAQVPIWREAAKGYFVWQKYLSLLYEKQSYTVGAKGFVKSPERPNARLEAMAPMLVSLQWIVGQHIQHTPNRRWQSFADILHHLSQIQWRQSMGYSSSALRQADSDYLNQLDLLLKPLAGQTDQPIVVDVHSVPALNQVATWATGFARTQTFRNGEDQQPVRRGARFTTQQFKQPLNQRLNNSEWREQLRLQQQEAMPL